MVQEPSTSRLSLRIQPVQPSPKALGALAYVLDGDLYVADPNGANPVRIVNGRPGTGGCTDEYWAEGTIWSPDGRFLAARHARRCQDGRSGWWDAVDLRSGGRGRRDDPQRGVAHLLVARLHARRGVDHLARDDRLVYGLDGGRQAVLQPGGMAPGDFDPVWSSDGASLLLPHGVEIMLDGSLPRQLPPDDPRSQPAVDSPYSYSPAYSPDGSRIAYVDRTSLVVAATDGSDARQVSVSGPWVDDPVWSPAGDRIAFIYSERGGQASTELRVLDVATGQVTSLAGMGGSDYYSWSSSSRPRATGSSCRGRQTWAAA